MYLHNLTTTEGAILNNFSINKPFYLLKKDPFNHFLWKSLKKDSTLTRAKKLENFKTRFIKN
jgi:hypothetical protein|tara:strand:+ start:4962 stop:5147 length:186 start_codon:yes stop_codon:yes gene_type:complete